MRSNFNLDFFCIRGVMRVYSQRPCPFVHLFLPRQKVNIKQSVITSVSFSVALSQVFHSSFRETLRNGSVLECRINCASNSLNGIETSWCLVLFHNVQVGGGVLRWKGFAPICLILQKNTVCLCFGI